MFGKIASLFVEVETPEAKEPKEEKPPKEPEDDTEVNLDDIANVLGL